MNQIPGPNESWNPCPPGLIQEVAAKSSIGRRQLFTWGLSLAVIAMVVVGATISMMATEDDQSQGKPAVSCVEIRQNFSAFGNCEIQCCILKQIMTNHLAKCPECRCEFKKQFPCEKATIKPPCQSNAPCP